MITHFDISQIMQHHEWYEHVEAVVWSYLMGGCHQKAGFGHTTRFYVFVPALISINLAAVNAYKLNNLIFHSQYS